ncbi:MAG: hypothetical protein ACRD8Z_00785 [Nitrososphaeraceae archaeon]
MIINSEFRDVINNRNAAMGIFITLFPPASEMVKEVNKTEPDIHEQFKIEYPKLQIITIKELLSKKLP